MRASRQRKAVVFVGVDAARNRTRTRTAASSTSAMRRGAPTTRQATTAATTRTKETAGGSATRARRPHAPRLSSKVPPAAAAPATPSTPWTPAVVAPSSAKRFVLSDLRKCAGASTLRSLTRFNQGAHPLPDNLLLSVQPPASAASRLSSSSRTLLRRELSCLSSSSPPRQLLWDSIVAGILAIASASWLLLVPSNRSTNTATTTHCESSTTTTSPAASPHHPAHPANVVSFRPRWFNNILSGGAGGGGGPASASSSGGGGGSGDGTSAPPLPPPPVASIMNADPQGVLLQSTGKPYDVSVRAIRGGRFTMEDEYFVANGGRFAAVFDGHGGSGVAQLLKKQLYAYVTHFLLVKHWEESEYDDDLDEPLVLVGGSPDGTEASSVAPSSKPVIARRRRTARSNRPSLSSHVSALRAAFEKIERDVMEDDNLEFQGSTAVAVVLYESEDGHRTLLSANVGDSRAVLSRNGRAVDLTHDHKPNDEREKARIMAMGETIEWDQDCKVHRVRNLSLARAIGDRYAKPAVSPEVEIQHFPIVEDEDEFVVIASDGLWDVMTSQDAVSFVHEQMRKELSADSMSKETADNYRLVLRRNMAKFLAREAIRKGSSDNVSVLMVWL